MLGFNLGMFILARIRNRRPRTMARPPVSAIMVASEAYAPTQQLHAAAGGIALALAFAFDFAFALTFAAHVAAGILRHRHTGHHRRCGNNRRTDHEGLEKATTVLVDMCKSIQSIFNFLVRHKRLPVVDAREYAQGIGARLV